MNYANSEKVDALINDSEASGQSTYSSSKIDEDYQQKDSDISGGAVQYVASSSGNAPASGSTLGNIAQMRIVYGRRFIEF